MRRRWLAVVVVLLVAGAALLRSHPSSAALFGDFAARGHASAAAAEADQQSDADGPAALPAAAVASAALPDRDSPSAFPAGPQATATRAAHASDPVQVAAAGHETGTSARRTASASAAVSAPAAAMVAGTAATTPVAGTALAGGVSTSGLQPRPTIVRSNVGTATIYNAQIEVGFLFDPSDNPNHRLQFNGPDVAKSEFTLAGEAVGDVTIDGQQAVAGQWYPLHAGLTLTAVNTVAVHVRPLAPKTDG